MAKVEVDTRKYILGKHMGRTCVWIACPICGIERWVPLHKGKPHYLRCHKCVNLIVNVGDRSWSWKGGRIRTSEGYIKIWLSKDDFFYPMVTKDGYVMEHRIIMARYLNRCLLPWEIIHHKNGVRDDNRLENLELLPGHHYHVSDSLLKSKLTKQAKKINELEKRITLLEAENVLLKSDSTY